MKCSTRKLIRQTERYISAQEDVRFNLTSLIEKELPLNTIFYMTPELKGDVIRICSDAGYETYQIYHVMLPLYTVCNVTLDRLFCLYEVRPAYCDLLARICLRLMSVSEDIKQESEYLEELRTGMRDA